MLTVFERPKLKIVIIAVACLLVLTTILVVVACVNARSDDEKTVDAFVEKTNSNSEATTITPSEPTIYDHLIFEANSDGCTLVAVSNFPDTILSIPEKCPHGDSVTEIGDYAFEGCSKLLEINLPATVKSIGNGSFVGCSSLVAINVDSSNPKFCSVGGVLFSRDRTKLICYPAAKVGTRYLLSTNVKEIAPYAFDGVSNLKAILYEGSTAKYQSIEIGSGNRIFTSLPVTCNYSGAKK